jgi:hypothetical protein
MDTNQTFLGRWNVVEQQYRIRGKWVSQGCFALGEWIVAFFAKGRFSEIFRRGNAPEEISTCNWTIAPQSEIITLHSSMAARRPICTIVFSDADGEPCLYFFDDAPHILHDRASIVDFHAHERWRLLHCEISINCPTP